MPPRPLVVVGPSGVGKGTLIAMLQREFPDKFGFSVSHTTRAPRPGEVNGTHYNFVDKATMERDIASGKFLEHANVHQNIYGTSFAAVRAVSKQGRICILDIDVQGAEAVKKSTLNAAYVFIAPPSMEELEKRLRGRGTEAEDAVLKRLENARTEMAKKDVPGFFDAIIVNDDLDAAYEALKRVIAERVESDSNSRIDLARLGPYAFGVACAVAIAARVIINKGGP
ncbi:Guanylate kinase [Ostreococcus tauri]|uniref:Guanylate kinase 1 n=1 Tax=Ostreococcus tauri TaxID=70448 RepID=A0A454Y0A3_OSTTA|nr:Guanylate kinase [Ostreococcus tauri]OUS42976.1 P-loop containing nucleoside triphosphate hydrolase protein [Ostreococcus tauri]OUS43176.1 P-loop containing nucleoside triphosphate hydrolase protein [Ostreococcus tauri]CAL57290.1 Guanylate kinase [Ostreococcus tauri]|eukprot:XP_003082344.1 Guanylate kinase [Ostreococcus tauri]